MFHEPPLAGAPGRVLPVLGDGEGMGAAVEEFGPYRLHALIGQGGMGEVYRAVDTRKDREVALKRLSAALARDERFQARFRREAELVARLTDAHIIPIHDYGEIDRQLYLDMRLVEGVDLGAVISEHGPLAPARAVDLVAQAAEALDAAHGTGLVHRDVKPSNMLLAGPERDFLYLIDFGIAHAVGATHMTSTGVTVGTMAYMAPERFSETDAGDHRVDVYALACVLHQALTGSVPYPLDALPRVIHAHLSTPPPRPSTVRPDVPAAFDDVVTRGMAKDPDARYASAGALADAARAALATAAPRPATPYPATPRPATPRPATPRPATPRPATPPEAPAEAVAPVRGVADPDATDPRVAVPAAPRRRRRRLLVAAAVGVLAVAGLVAGLLVATRETPLPADAAFEVADQVTTIAQYDDRLKVVGALYGAKAPTEPAGADRFRRDSAKALAITTVLQRAEAAQNIVVSDADAQNTLNGLVTQQFGAGPDGRQRFLQGVAQAGVTEAQVIEEIRQQMASARLIDQVTRGVTVTDTELPGLFPQYRDRLGTPEKRHLANIVVADQQTAQGVATRLGGEPFGEVAREVSTDTSTNAEGGDLGTLSADQLEAGYSQAAFAAPRGAVFGPVQTSHGWNVGTVLDVVPAVPATDIARVEPQLKQMVLTDRKTAVYNGWLTDRIREAHVRYADAYRPADPDTPTIATTTPSPGPH